MLDPTAIASGVFASVVGAKTKEVIEEALHEHGPGIVRLLEENNALLVRILDQQSSQDNPDILESISFQADALGLPGSAMSWMVPDYPRNHLMMLVGGGGTIFYQVPGMQVINKSVSTSGWYQLDLPPGTLISSNNAKTVYIKWSDFAHGTSF